MSRRRLVPLEPGDPRHGTETGYANHYCRCGECREANRLYQERRRRKAGVRCAGDVAAEKRARIQHGTWGGYNTLKCRCDECRRWSRENRKFWRDRAKARAS